MSNRKRKCNILRISARPGEEPELFYDGYLPELLNLLEYARYALIEDFEELSGAEFKIEKDISYIG